MRKSKIVVSVVSTLFYSETFLDEFLTRTLAAIKTLKISRFEIILVNDGSPDKSLEKAREAQKAIPQIRIIDLSRNFGHHNAMLAGLTYSTGNYVFLIDSDLEESPELLVDFYKLLRQKKEVDVVFGYQEKRKGKLPERLLGYVFYSTVRKINKNAINRNVSTVRLMSRRYVDALLLFVERETPISVLWDNTGFAQLPFPIEKKSNSGRKSTYSLVSKLKLALSMFLIVGYGPIVIVSAFLILTFIAALLVGTYIAVMVLSGALVMSGWTSLMLSMWMLGIINLTISAIIALYVANIYSESKARPKFIVRDLMNGETRNE